MALVSTGWDVIERGSLRDEANLVAELIAEAAMDGAERPSPV
jgi:hypothetical protein